MGIDIEIAIGLKNKPDEAFINRMKNLLKDCSPIEGNLYICTDEVEDIERFSTVYGISSISRYYGEGYERGPFLSLYGLLIFLRKAFKEYEPTIFYGGDCNDSIPEFRESDLDLLMDHFIKVGSSPYRDKNYNEPFIPEKE